MARLSNQKIADMTLRQADTYTDLHPAEAWRFAKAHGRSTIKQTTVLKLRNYLLNRKPLNLSNLIAPDSSTVRGILPLSG